MLYTLETVRPFIVDCVKAGRPAMVHARRGTGKTAMMESIAAELFDGRYMEFRAPNRDPMDVAGIPAVDIANQRASMVHLAGVLPCEADGPNGLLSLDELNRAPRQMQSALLGLTNEGRHLAPGWRIVATGNIAAERAFIEPMDPALESRFEHFFIQGDVSESIAWGERNGMNPAVLAFLKHAPELLYTDPEPGEFASANPRAYAQLADVLDVAPRERWAGHARAKCGSRMAERFAGFLMIWERLPPLPFIIANPETAPVPDSNEPGLLYALQSALARAADLSNVAAVFKYLDRLPREFAIAAVTDATRRNPALKETGPYVAWAIRVQDVTI